MSASGPFFIDSHAIFPARRLPKPAIRQSGDPEENYGDGPNTSCGIGACRPSCLQPLANVGTFVGASSVNALMTSIFVLYIVSQITTIEKEFGLNSSQSGFLLSCNDIGFLTTSLFASYTARKVHIPRVLGLTTALYGLAGMVCSLPYFISKDAFLREIGEEDMNNSSFPVKIGGRGPLCSMKDARNNVTSCEDSDNASIGLPNQYTRTAVALIAIGMIVQGMAKGPRSAFSTAYIDDNGSKSKTAMYMGILTGIGIIGPAVAFAAGSVFSRVYVTLEDVSISPGHPAWVGAWWIGFLVFGAISVFTATPVAFFPRALKGSPYLQKDTKENGLSTTVGLHVYVTDFILALKRLWRNSVYVPLVVFHCISALMVGGSSAFIVKYVETQFFIPTWKANLMLGLLVVFSACLGSVVGGCVVTKKELSPLDCCKVMVGVTLITGMLHCLGYVFGCNTPQVIGIGGPDDAKQLGSYCKRSCDCQADGYFPVCGSDGRNYFSPCFAGCQATTGEMYTSCRCIGINGTASPGLCVTECDMLYPYLCMITAALFLGTLGTVPSLIVLLRCVDEEDKAIALGFNSFICTLIGLIPGPIIVGKLVDNACLVWTKSCESHGACALYDNTAFRIAKTSYDVAPKLVMLILNIVVYIVAKRKLDWSTVDKAREGTTTDTDILMNPTNDYSTIHQPSDSYL